MLRCQTSNIQTHSLFDHESKNVIVSSIALEAEGVIYMEKAKIKCFKADHTVKG